MARIETLAPSFPRLVANELQKLVVNIQAAVGANTGRNFVASGFFGVAVVFVVVLLAVVFVASLLSLARKCAQRLRISVSGSFPSFTLSATAVVILANDAQSITLFVSNSTENYGTEHHSATKLRARTIAPYPMLLVLT